MIKIRKTFFLLTIIINFSYSEWMKTSTITSSSEVFYKTVDHFTFEGNNIYAAYDDVTFNFKYILRSKNNGKTWESNYQSFNSIHGYINKILPSGDTLFIVSTMGKIFFSLENGLWQQANMPNATLKDLVISEGNLLALDSNYNIYISKNNTETWTKVTIDTTNIQISRFIKDNNNIFALESSGNGRIFLSTDGGIEWSEIKYTDTPIDHYPVSVVKSNNTILVLIPSMGNNGSLFRSEDNGVSWDIDSSAQWLGIVKLIRSGTNFIRRDFLWPMELSTDNGLTWSITCSLSSSTDYFNLCSGGNNVIVKTSADQIFLSKDNGVSWNLLKINDFLHRIYDLMVHKNKLYAVTANWEYKFGLSMSDDKGSTWANINTPFPFYPMRSYNIALEDSVISLTQLAVFIVQLIVVLHGLF